MDPRETRKMVVDPEGEQRVAVAPEGECEYGRGS